MSKIYPSVLIISNKFDFGTDHVSFQLKKIGISYWRLNRDELSSYSIYFDPSCCKLVLANEDVTIVVAPDTLKSIYYRAPTFLRETLQNIDGEEQLEKSQWAAFIRALSIFQNIRWLNNPVSTYYAEMKPVQLTTAYRIGFKIPSTLIGNMWEHDIINLIPGETVVLKTVDTGYITGPEKDGFIYTNFIEKKSLSKENTRSIPFILQEALLPKTDIRVTVVGDKQFPVAIKSAQPINEDWRLKKYDLYYEVIELPKEIMLKCDQLLKRLDLRFGGIDLILHENEYYFIEVNPTGEWDWLQHHTGCEIDVAIAHELCQSLQ